MRWLGAHHSRAASVVKEVFALALPEFALRYWHLAGFWPTHFPPGKVHWTATFGQQI